MPYANRSGAISRWRAAGAGISVFSSAIVYISFIAALTVCDLVLFMLMLHGRCDHHHAAAAGGSPYCAGDIGMSRTTHRGPYLSDAPGRARGSRARWDFVEAVYCNRHDLQRRLCR